MRNSPSFAFFVDSSDGVLLQTILFGNLRTEMWDECKLPFSKKDETVVESTGTGLILELKSDHVFFFFFDRAILTASRRPESVGELSMSASNTSSVLVLTYSRTNREQERTLSTKTDQNPRQQQTCVFPSTSLCVFSAGLFVGWRAARVSVWIQPLQTTPVNNKTTTALLETLQLIL